jgi:hypothetical protein
MYEKLSVKRKKKETDADHVEVPSQLVNIEGIMLSLLVFFMLSLFLVVRNKYRRSRKHGVAVKVKATTAWYSVLLFKIPTL